MSNIRYSSSAGLLLILAFTLLSFPYLSTTEHSEVTEGLPGYPDSPVPAHTGGFGELNCQSCHFDMPLNDPDGSLVLNGIPDPYEPGEEYLIEVQVEHLEMNRGGFQLSVRFSDESELEGEQAGNLISDSTDVKITTARDIQYAHHTMEGTEISTDNSSSWTITWSAPEEQGMPVVFHAAANAANGDDSEFEDHIYTTEVTVQDKR